MEGWNESMREGRGRGREGTEEEGGGRRERGREKKRVNE